MSNAYTNEQLLEEVVKRVEKHYKIPELKARLKVGNWTDPKGSGKTEGSAFFYFIGRYSNIISSSTKTSYTLYHQSQLIAPDNIDDFVSKFLSGLTTRIHNVLLDICNRVHPKGSSKLDDLIFCQGNDWRDQFLSHPILTAVYDIEVKYNEKKTYAIATFTNKNKRLNLTAKAYLQYTKAGVKFAKPENFEFKAIEEGRDKPIRIQELERSSFKTNLDTTNVVLQMPRKGYDSAAGVFTHWEIIEQEPDSVIVEQYRVAVDWEHYEIQKLVFTHTVKLFSSGKPFLTTTIEEEIMDTWLVYIRDPKDVFKNPHNVCIHKYLDTADVPKYEGEDVYITSEEDIYIRMNDVWVPIDGGLKWLESYSHVVPWDVTREIERYELAKKLMR